MSQTASEYEGRAGAHRTSLVRARESFAIFLSKPLNAASFALTASLCLIAILAPVLAPYPYDAIDLAKGLTPPSWDNLLGTDTAGRDIFSRLLYGARMSLQIALVTVAFGMLVGVTIGAVAGYFGRWVDEVLMRIVEIFMAVPGIVMALALVAVLGPSIPSIILALSIRRITQFARVTRGAVLSVKTMDYISACHALGMSHPRIIFGHVLPNCVGPLIVLSSVLIGNVILTESALSFLGMGIQEPTPSIGTMIASGNEFLTFAPWISLFPGLFLLLVMLGFNLLGDGLRDHLDPRDGNVS
ncbi:ABC transporter permease [Marinovum sp.]|uniref:ABC transporter permease n=1 Tax=Marinovum sp. TaxID=2024839 RepID=UPI002B2773B0|nr:ABC transporter permease [Marinovum sp.]